MPSFDVVSELDMHEVNNAVDQANREIGTRYDFKGVNASFEASDSDITMAAEGEFQLQQMRDILINKLVKRSIDPKALDFNAPAKSGMQVKQQVGLKQGLDQPTAKKIVKLIKDKKMKVQAAIQGDQVRVTGKKRDDLQQAIAMLREADIDLPLQFNNFRD
ncbi:YajQ family cyclic di-GMP-binding protein [Motiliproteus coralliicola]|uniref:Nucleotide-binding protein DV711_13570 n=1 Tax=Motiliproteus coralliicola TaxID=2283196 RepID=A0A369WDQ6_9GAMM|nr:YajQ family cyclic di-GMP-binding protein [Motiliproteus coralliicola]RDE19892.1 YajQ family cyclic di-GMP-binding protein [Motiliproteus coralliicola]